jgi:hypothetical protein
MISRDHQLAVTRQAKLLGLSRAPVYYTPEPVDDTGSRPHATAR